MNEGKPQPVLTSLEDTMLVAYLMLNGHTAKPWLSKDDPIEPRVSFDIYGKQAEIESHMQEFYNNQLVGVQDFCRQLKSVKNIMYNMKRIGKG